MAKIIRTDLTNPADLGPMEHDWGYNGLDCMVTYEVLEAMLPQLDNHTAATYAFSRDLQGPALEMRIRGVLVDKARRAAVLDSYFEDLDRLTTNVERIVLDGVGMLSFNPNSPKDLQELFYNRLQIPPMRKRGKVTTDREALEKMEQYTIAQPIIYHLKAIRDLSKKISVLRTEIDPDGRIRTSYNIAGTETGRWSSSFSEFGTGGNLQNVEERLRSILIADPGMKFAKFDAKSGESYVVGAIEWNLFRDPRFLDAVSSGDVHTAVARICWPNLPWTGDLKKDKDLAEQPYYRHYTYRFMCKKLGHGSNYEGKPFTLATQSKLPISVVQDFQPKYFTAFPAHQQWHQWVRNEIRTRGMLISLMGRKRHFWGRRNDDETMREAIAFDPQGSLADIVNRALLRIWREFPRATIMMQDHDAITFQYPEEQEDEIIPVLWEMLVEKIPLVAGRELVIPYDCKVGWNKGEYHKDNLDGLRDYTPGDKSRRRTPTKNILDR